MDSKLAKEFNFWVSHFISMLIIFANMKILISPLDWGLGHATRTSALIKQLLADGHDIVISGSGKSIKFLQSDYPYLRSIELNSFSPFFFRHAPQWIAITLQVPWFLLCQLREWIRTQRIMTNEHFDMIISDNRYGVRCTKCKSILITHQLSPITASWAPQWINTAFAWCLSIWINKFDEIWVPDIYPYPNGLAGELAKPTYIRTKIKTIGLLSRLEQYAPSNLPPIEHLAIISGPEPQRTIMEDMIRNIFSHLDGEKIIFNGRQHTNAIELSSCIQRAKNIYCRSGYSTIMDLVKLNKTANLIATYGQAEQEYLCERMVKFGFKHIEK